VIILDTNVLSALMRDEPDRRVVEWLDGQSAVSTWITSITVFEVRLGLALLPDGRRRRALQQAFEGLLAEDLDGRILSFDSAAAAEAATLAASRQRAGINLDIRDTQKAGIAQARRASIATRNLRHFEGLTVPVVSPWGEDSTRSS
jgi:predicted nucleic acid-binding protein